MSAAISFGALRSAFASGKAGNANRPLDSGASETGTAASAAPRSARIVSRTASAACRRESHGSWIPAGGGVLTPPRPRGPPRRPAAGSPMDRGSRRAEASSLHPVREDRGDPAEGLQEERALFRFPGDELHAGSFLLRGRRELLDDVRLLEDGQGAAVRRADPELHLVDDRLLPLPAPV